MRFGARVTAAYTKPVTVNYANLLDDFYTLTYISSPTGFRDASGVRMSSGTSTAAKLVTCSIVRVSIGAVSGSTPIEPR